MLDHGHFRNCNEVCRIAYCGKVQSKNRRRANAGRCDVCAGARTEYEVARFGVRFLAGFASFGIGCATQVNAIAEVCSKNLGIDPFVVGVVVAGMTAVVIFGGIKSIAKVCEKLVPFMAAFYVIGCVVILFINYDYIIPAVTTICRLAFTKGAAAGGLVGGGIRYAIQYGVARGLFSNESGLGSAPIAAAAAKTKKSASVRLLFLPRERFGIRLSSV